MKQTTRTSYTASQILMEIIMDHGTSPDAFETLTGVQHSRISDPDGWIPMASYVRLWELAIDATGDPALALRLREKTGMRSIHFVVQLAMHCSTLAEALLHFNKYSRLLSETDKIELSDNGDLVEITYTNSSPYQTRWLPEHNFSLAIELGRSLVNGSYDPVSVSFQHADPGYKEVYDEVFRAPVLFQQPENNIILRKNDLLKPITARDPYLKKILMNYAELSMNKKHKQETLQEKVESFIVAGLPNGETTLDAAAAAMNMTRSTLYRQLKTEGTSFQKLLLKTRQELAKNHLRNGMTNSQVAYLLGFSEPSAFQRAFKCWYHINPGEYRKTVNDRIM